MLCFLFNIKRQGVVKHLSSASSNEYLSKIKHLSIDIRRSLITHFTYYTCYILYIKHITRLEVLEKLLFKLLEPGLTIWKERLVLKKQRT